MLSHGKFPSPRRGPIFSTINLKMKKFKYPVSVPTKGTHLLYRNTRSGNTSYRVSVPTKGTHLLYDNKEVKELEKTMFPSPRRGPIFSTKGGVFNATYKRFPSPRRGPIFSTSMKISFNNDETQFPSPRSGLKSI